MSEDRQTRDVLRIPWVRLLAEFAVIFLGISRSLLADSLSANLSTIYNWYVYKVPRATYAGLRSTGRLTLIQDDQLRREITTY